MCTRYRATCLDHVYPLPRYVLGRGQYRNAVASGRRVKCFLSVYMPASTRRYRVTVLTSPKHDRRWYRSGPSMTAGATDLAQA